MDFKDGPEFSLFPKGTPVTKSADLIRIAALPRRKPLDLDSIEAKAMVEYEMRKYSLGNDNCKCAELDPQIKLGNRTCIKQFLPIQAWALYEMSVAGGLVGSIFAGAGKCGRETVEIFDYLRCERRSIAESGYVDVASMDNKKLVIRSSSAFSSGSKQCVRFTLADGSAAEFSNDHPVYTQRGWVDASKLVAGQDFATVAIKMPEPLCPVQVSDDEVKFVAYMLSDGGCSQDALMFTNGTPEVIEDWSDCSTRLGYVVKEIASSSQAKQYRLNGAYKRTFRKKWDLYGLAKEKRAHPRIWGLPSNQVALFLNRFWACDGHVSKRAIECTLASEKLIDDLRFLCTRLGIRTRKHYKQATYLKDGVRKYFDSWRIMISGQAALQFLECVGPVLGKESACDFLKQKLNQTTRNTNYDVVPINFSNIMEICDELGFMYNERGRRPRTEITRFFNTSRNQNVSREKFIEFCRRWNYSGKYAHLATTDIAWERVVKVEDIGIHAVYDLSVPGTHNFVANGILVHNTTLNIMGALALGEARTLLLVPPGLIEQLQMDYLLIQQHFKVPNIIVTTSGKSDWRRIQDRSAPVLYVLPYSLLQGKKNSDIIEQINPHAIIADETDALKGLDSARTRRLLRFFTGNESMTQEQRAARSRTKFACWTGSLTDSSILEYGHLSAFALKDKSPLPLDQETLQEWARCLDAVPNPCPPGALVMLCNPGEDVRSAYRRRLSETMGFITTRTANVKISGGESLVRNNILEREAPPIPDIVQEALDCVRNFERPDTLAGSKYNEEIVEAMEQARYAQQIATGMFYRWVFPRREPEHVIDEWFAARKAWRKEQRYKLYENIEQMDSPGLLEDAAKRFYGDIPEDGKVTWKSEAWTRWRDVKDLVQPKTQAVRLHDFLVRDAIEWATTNRGIVWYNMVEFATWMGQLSGLPVHEGGLGAGERLRREDGSRSIIASIKSHGRGRNGLQYLFNHQLVAQTPASSRVYEQLLRRLFRQGQKNDLVTSEIYMHTPEVRSSFENALRRAEYVKETMGQDQTILDGWFDGEEE